MSVTRPHLYFLHATGCPACAATEPFIAAWEKKNGHRLAVTRVDLAETEWKARWEPRVTPTLVMLRPDGTKRVREGSIDSAEELNAWVREALR